MDTKQIFQDNEVERVSPFADDETDQISTSFIFAEDEVDPPLEVVAFDQIEPEIDPAKFLANKKLELLQSYTSEFGPVIDDRATSNFLTETGFGKNLDAWMSVLGDSNEINSLRNELLKLEREYPEIMNTPEGEMFRKEMQERMKSAIETNEISFDEIMNELIEYGTQDPVGLAEVVLNESIYNPLLPVLSVLGYMIGGLTGTAASKALGFQNLMRRLKLGTARERLAAFNLEKVITEGTGVAAMEAGLAAGDEALRNLSVGRDVEHNIEEYAQLGAALGFSAKMLQSSFKVIRGELGAYKNFKEVVGDLSYETGLSEIEVIRALQNRMHELPAIERIKNVMAQKKDKIHAEVEPYKKVDRDQVTIKDIDAHIKRYIDEGSTTENPVSQRPIGIDAAGTVFHNTQNILDDFKSGFRFLQGQKRDGKLGVSNDAKARQKVFQDIDTHRLKKELYRTGNGVKSYADLLLKMEQRRKTYMKDDMPLDESYRRAFKDTAKEMGLDYDAMLRKSFSERSLDKIQSGVTYATQSAAQVLKDPSTLYKPVKDVFVDTKEFIKDVVRGPKEGNQTALNTRDILADILRDWEGNKMAGELEVNRFSTWVKKEIPNSQKREAIAHYLEGNLDEYNKYRASNGLSDIVLNENDLKVAASIRKYLDDMLDWAQRAELFNYLRHAGFRRTALQKGKAPKSLRDFIRQYKNQDNIPDDELWKFVEGIKDAVGYTRQIDALDNLRKRENYVPHMIKDRFAPTEEDLLGMVLSDAHRSAKLQTRSRFTKARTYPTMLEALDAGEKLYTQDIATLINAYGKSMIRAQINNRLMQRLHTQKTADGYPMIGGKHETPNHYIEFRHPNFRTPTGDYMRVNPNLAPDLRLYFDTNNPSIANRILQNIILISKRASLGFSFFHVAALAWSGLATGQNPNQVFKNLVPGLKSKGLAALAGGEGYEEIIQGIRNGLGIGVLEELKGNTLINAMRSIANTADSTVSKITHFKPLGKMVAAPIRVTARAQEIIDKYLWDHVNTGLKATTYLTTIERLKYEDALRAHRTNGKLTDIDLLRQRAAQFTNDAYGNQNWNQMAMNVRSHMGHRIAAALNKPSTRGYVRMLVFAPDWTLSNLRVISKAATGAYGKSKLPGAGFVDDKATSEYIRYTIRSALMYAFIAEALQQAAGEGSIFDDDFKDALRPDLGNGKQMEISKQLSEVLRIGVHGPVHVFSHKLGTLPKSLEHTDSWQEYLAFWGMSSIPISLKVGLENEDPTMAVAGALGAPLYNK